MDQSLRVPHSGGPRRDSFGVHASVADSRWALAIWTLWKDSLTRVMDLHGSGELPTQMDVDEQGPSRHHSHEAMFADIDDGITDVPPQTVPGQNFPPPSEQPEMEISPVPFAGDFWKH